jgi:fructose-1,6-bisphosphatase/sedoheptulose 1,7-bisphosphatase-like protein
MQLYYDCQMRSVRHRCGPLHTGVIAAAALKCMGGHLQGRLHPRNDEERKRAIAAGYDLDAILHTNDLAKGDQVLVPSCTVPAAQLLPRLPQCLCTALQQHLQRG